MIVESVRVHMLSSQHVVILREADDERYLPIWIGSWEAQSIAMKLQGVEAERPLTHDLLTTILGDLGANLDRGAALAATQTDDPDSPEAACIQELLDAIDAAIPEPERDVDKPFLMPVEDVFSISGRGTVATGRVESGIVKVGDEIEIVGIRETQKTTITGVEMFRKLLDEGQAGDNIGALLRGTKREEIVRGQVLAAPGSITPHKKFKAECYILTKEEGGRHTPFFNGYRPQFYFRTTDVTGVCTLEEGVEMVMPGDNIHITGELITPIAMQEGLRFAIREGGRTVGAGVISEIIE